MKKIILLHSFLLVMVSALTALNPGRTNKSFQIFSSITENKGQITDDSGNEVSEALAKISMPLLDVYITQKGISYIVMSYEPDEHADIHPVYINETKYKVKYSRVNVELTGSSINKSQFLFSEEASWKSNYYSGPQKPLLALKHYQKLVVKNIYPGIDWVWQVSQSGKLEYDFIVHPEGNVADIKMKYAYADLIDKTNQLSITSHNGTVIEGPLKALSDNIPIDISYKLNRDSKEISFLCSDYDHSKDFIIDPPLALQWSAQYGGTFADGFRGVAVDTSGYIYLTGYTTSYNFPSYNPGGSSYYDGSFNGVKDAMVLKIDSNQNLLWATYFGGTGDDFANSVTVDKEGKVYVTGAAEAGFPLQNLSGAYNQTSCSAQDIFVARFDSTLNLNWCTFYGGAGNEEGLKIQTDISNNIYVCGYTNSAFTFPTQQSGGGYLQTNIVGNEAFVLKFDSSGTNNWATAYGGTGDDYATSLATDSLLNVVVTGFTTSTNFPITTSPPGIYHQNNNAGNTDGFILRFNNSTSRLSATYYGGSNSDYFTDITSGANGSFFFTGRTISTNFPLRPAPGFGFNQTALAGSYDAFIVKCTNDLDLWWSTYYGGNDIDAGTGVVCDDDGRLYITGFTFSNNFPLDSPLYAGVWYQSDYKGNSDGFVGGFTNLGAQFWSSYKGDSCYEYPADIAFDNKYNKFYVAGEGMFKCGVSLPDSVYCNGGGSLADAFAWAFDDGSAAVDNGGGGNGGAPDCFQLELDSLRQPCPQQCNGSALLRINGGFSPYSIIWSSGETTALASQLCENESWVQVQDAMGCVVERVISFQSMTAPGNSQNRDCFGSYPGSATVLPTGGNPPYTYLWQNGGTSSTFNDLNFLVGTVTVTVTDNAGCSIQRSFVIDWDDAADPYQIEMLSSPVCGQTNGIIVASELNGTPANVNWSIISSDTSYYLYHTDTIFNMSFGTYYQILGAYGCYHGTPFPVIFHIDTISENLFISYAHSPVSCNTPDGSISVITSPYFLYYNPVNYVWSTGSINSHIDSLSVGDYSVTITDVSGCSVSLSYHLNSLDSIALSFDNSSIVLASCQNDSTGGLNAPTISGGTAPYFYLWSNGATGVPVNNLPAGIYSVTVTDANGCSALQADIELQFENGNYLAFDSIQPECFGATNGFIAAEIITDFGNQPYSYSYQWSNGQTGTQINNITPGLYSVTVTGNGGLAYNACITLSASLNQFTTAIVNTTYDCLSGNQAEATISGGTSPYSYSWSNGITSPINTAAYSGEIELRVTDGFGCITTDTQQVVIGLPFSASYTVENILCHGNSSLVNISAAGGFSPYSGTGNFLLPEGNHSYLVTDSNGCSAQLNFTLTAPDSLTASYTSTPVMCYGQQSSVLISASGGTSPYSGTGIFNFSAGTYNRVITDFNGCQTPVTFVVTSPTQLNIGLNQLPITCSTDTATITISASGGIAPYVGTGSYIFTADTTLIFSVADNNGCVTDSLVSINLINDSVFTTINNPVVCPHATLIFSIQNDIVNPIWYPDSSHGHSYILSDITESMVVNMVGITLDGCMVSEIYNVSIEDCAPNSVNNLEQEAQIYAYPNPASSFFTISIIDSNRLYSADIFDVAGRIILKPFEHQKEDHFVIDVSSFASGIYYVRLSDEFGNSVVKKLIIQQ